MKIFGHSLVQQFPPDNDQCPIKNHLCVLPPYNNDLYKLISGEPVSPF